jgi:hypothetical protein
MSNNVRFWKVYDFFAVFSPEITGFLETRFPRYFGKIELQPGRIWWQRGSYPYSDQRCEHSLRGHSVSCWYTCFMAKKGVLIMGVIVIES